MGEKGCKSDRISTESDRRDRAERGRGRMGEPERLDSEFKKKRNGGDKCEKSTQQLSSCQ